MIKQRHLIRANQIFKVMKAHIILLIYQINNTILLSHQARKDNFNNKTTKY